MGDPDETLRAWHAEHAREHPWRRVRPDPYAVLVCEVMSQQTQIGRVVERWNAWMERWPTIDALADASLADVLVAWQGLGYPRRARALHETARIVHERGWPGRLTDLPGVGAYTADAIALFAFDQPVLPEDVNVRRVRARRFPAGFDGDWRPRQLAEALMDLGQEVCRARPRCDACPVATGCPVAAGAPDPYRPPRRQAAYAGSLRQRRGRVLAALAAGESVPDDDAAIASLLADGLVSRIDGEHPSTHAGRGLALGDG